MGHTPGPWEVGEKRGVWAGPVVMADSGGRGVAFVCGSDANARLIAAAPELLATLREAKSELIELYERAYPDDESDNDTTKVIDAVIKAIARAEGRGD